MSAWIFQLSDLHFGQATQPLSGARAFPSLVEAVQHELDRVPAPLVIAICGDVVDKGNSAQYDIAARALEASLIRPLGSPAVVCCPGNHDVVNGENGLFAGFNRFAFRISNKADIAFGMQATVARLTLHDHEFILANSMYRGHEDRQNGEVNIEHLDRATSEASHAPRILVLHHSLIPNHRSDTSTLVNAYPLLQLSVERGIVAILHGHLHSQNVLTVGKAQTALVGVGSLLYRPWPNYNNGFNMLRFEGSTLAEAIAFRYVADLASGGTVGTFQKSLLPLL